MSEPVKVIKTHLHDNVWEVRNAETGEVIGYDHHTLVDSESTNGEA